MQVVKKVGAKLQARMVQPALVEHWTQRIRSLGKDIARINEVSSACTCLGSVLAQPRVKYFKIAFLLS